MLTFNDYRILVDDALRAMTLPERPAGLYEPIRYALQSGGKRLRPVLTLAAAEAVGAVAADALSPALAIEMFHNFTLIHDDVMDRSDTRRGRPTVVKRWGLSTAILSGDTLLTLASRRLSDGCPVRLLEPAVKLFDRTAIEVYEGQQLDMDMEGAAKTPSVDDYLEMIRLKTSVLLGCACAMGALIGGASEAVQKAFYAYGENLGMAFQLRDDLLDTFGDPLTFGKATGSDILNDKNTWLRLSLPAESRPCGSLGGRSKTEAWKQAYKDAGLPERCQKLIEDYTQKAVDALPAEMTDDARAFFRAVALEASTRAV